MMIFLAGLLAALPAQAKSLVCQVTTSFGPYAGGAVSVEERDALSVRWRSPDGREETFVGGTKICAQETRGFPRAPVCTTSFTSPTPLRKMVTLCRLPQEAGAKWVGSLSLALDPRDGSGSLRCTTALGPYTDFDLRLSGCRED